MIQYKENGQFITIVLHVSYINIMLDFTDHFNISFDFISFCLICIPIQ